jgi:lauroyl/myristoyl acyltransferase
MAWAARLDKGKGYELNVKPVNILSGTGRVEDDVALMNQAIEQLVSTLALFFLANLTNRVIV